ncbi:class I SAM-dependent methyltransferase [Cypionkella sp.]|uniref:class I SAM-dependent methyltransferase n=1 Tax=Cypionkella sp. TaxID=2811411 RepID=UPI0026090DCF|nr:class I SAM-dependent methyltransferase [Cypionkella sp.]
MTISATQTVKRLLDGPPDAARLEQAFRHLAKWRSELISNTLVGRSGTKVTSGPFRGMDYPVRASEGSRAARLLGSYESSLAPVIEEIVTKAYPVIIDVGSAEGYYAVGLARRLPNARVLARDANPKAQVLCAALAAANGVADRVEVGGLMDHADFDLCHAQKTLVVCDIEGAEAELLDPVLAPGLAAADILVEAHDCMRPGLSGVIAERFKATHNIRVIGRRLDDSGLPDWMEGLSDLDRLVALWEWRSGPTPWLWMVKK